MGLEILVNDDSGNGLVTWRHQASTSTNVDIPLRRSSGVHSKLIFASILKISFLKFCSKFTHLKSQPDLPGDYEPKLTHWGLLLMKMECQMLHMSICHSAGLVYRADSRFAPSQWETALLCNDVSHWLGARVESALNTWILHFAPSGVWVPYYSSRLTWTCWTSQVPQRYMWVPARDIWNAAGCYCTIEPRLTSKMR